jgi:hypothetical protein
MNTEKEKEVQPYEKPMLRIIELAAEEVMGIGCKSNSTGGYTAPPCVCSALGS